MLNFLSFKLCAPHTKKLFKSQFPENFQPRLRRKAVLHTTINRRKLKQNLHLEKNYEKIIAQFVKYKKEKNESIIDSNRQSRFIINKMIKLDSSNLKRDQEPIDIVYMRLFLMQHIKILSYPKKSFNINYVQVFIVKLNN